MTQFNGNCDKKNNGLMESIIEQRIHGAKEEHKLAKYEYVRVRREEDKIYEQAIVDMWKEEPILFYRFINGNIKHK